MKKNIFFLILILGVITFLIPNNCYATTATFYEAEFIPGIWMNKAPLRGNTIVHYQTARFFRKTGTDDFAYCIEPFKFFDSTKTYESTLDPTKLTTEQKERISLLAHFGYGYKNHTEEKWYPITQFMIWQAADPEGDYYFTDSLNGNRIIRFQTEIEEINNLINEYQKTPTIANKTYTLEEDNTLILTDQNNVLKNYKINNFNNAKITNNTLSVSNLKEGINTVELTYKDTFYNKPCIFYQAENSQDLIETGDIAEKKINLTIKVIKTSLLLTKIDNDTKNTIPSGEAKLEGAIYQLYDDKMNKLTTITIAENSQGLLENLHFGKYFIQEIAAGEGYEIDPQIYTFEITEKKPIIDLILENKVIKNTIKLHKLYGTDNNFQNEKNINFNIYNKNNELLKTITTNESGIAEITLPYGTYIIKQLTTTKGYQKIEPITIEITNKIPIIYTLKDYKITVPNTKTTSILSLIISWLKKYLC